MSFPSRVCVILATGFLVAGNEAFAEQHETFVALTAARDVHRFDGLHQELLQIGRGDLRRGLGWEPNYLFASTGVMERGDFKSSRYSLGVGWRHYLADSPRWFVDVSFAPTYLTRYYFPDDDSYENLGTRFHFATRFGFGYAFDGNYGFIVHLEHLSNGGLGDLNPGTNQVGAALYVEL